MRPTTALDWTAFALVIIGALAWGFFAFDINILDIVLEAIWDPLDNIVFALIALAGLYLLVRAFARS
ncbi:DUF378 domain-containing protein [Pelagibacterium halotolerans]|uniref:DUF378 domain-containing protein n=1 Tax=Pelagibacterium halotolerans TaxID=531813 RepID=UPI00384E17B3